MRLLVRAVIFLLLCGAVTRGASESPVVRASELIGTRVVDAQGERLGEIKDVVFDTRNGKILHVTIALGHGFLGIGKKEAAFSTAQLVFRNDAVMLDIPDEALRATAAFDDPTWPAMRASQLIQREVQDRLRRDSGEIVDLLVDLAERRVAHALVDVRDDWRSGEKLVTVPIEQFSLPRDMGEFATLNIVREKLDGAGR
jgi:sporulation protein YlmC with PRC-barrel domain